jgi:hypothetical protein
MIAIDAGKRGAGMVAQGDQTEPQGAASFAVGVAVPMKVVVVNDRAVERRTIRSGQNNHRRRFDQRPRRGQFASEHPTAAPRARKDFDTMVRDRQDAAARRRIVQNFQAYTVFTGSRVWSATLAAGATDAFGATGGGTCAGGAAASVSSSSSFIPALNALMPFAKSPITRGSFPAPNRMRIMAKTTIQCIKLKEPIATTSERWRKTIITSFSAELPAHSGAAARCYEVVPMSGKSTPVSEIERR